MHDECIKRVGKNIHALLPGEPRHHAKKRPVITLEPEPRSIASLLACRRASRCAV